MANSIEEQIEGYYKEKLKDLGNGGQSTKDFDKLVVKGPKTATKVTKIEYGTEKSCPTLFGIYKFSDGYETQTNVRVTLSDDQGSKELGNLLDGK